jgi:hypothetical protein
VSTPPQVRASAELSPTVKTEIVRVPVGVLAAPGRGDLPESSPLRRMIGPSVILAGLSIGIVALTAGFDEPLALLVLSVVTVLLAYAYGDSTTNLIQPFFAIPILAVTRLRFGDIVGYTFLIAAACFAVTTLAMFLIPARL